MARRHAFMAVVAAALTMVASSARAAESVLQVIPADAMAFAAVNHLKDSDAKLQKLAQQVHAPAVSLLALAKATSGVQKGLDETGTAAAVVMPGVGFKADPEIVIIVPVTNYKEFVNAWGVKTDEAISEATVGSGNVLVANRGSYAIFAEASHREVLQKVLDSKNSIAETQPQFAAWLTENDTFAVSTNAGVKKASRAVQEHIKQMKAMFAKFGDEFREQMKTQLAVMDMYADAFQVAEKEIAIIGVAGKLDKDGNVRIGTRVRFLTGGHSLAAQLAKVKPIAENGSGNAEGTFGTLPGGMFALAIGGPWDAKLFNGFRRFQELMIAQALPALEPKQVQEQVDLAFKNSAAIKSIAFLLGPGEPGQPIVSDMVAVYDVENAAKYLDNVEKQLQVFAEAAKKAEKPAVGYAIKRIEVAGCPTLEVAVENKQATKEGHAEIMKAQMERFFGVGGQMKMYFAVIGEHRLACSIGNSAPLLRVIDTTKNPTNSLAHDADLKKTQALLPSDAVWAGYFSPGGLVAFWTRMIGSMMPANLASSVPSFPASQPIGVAIKAVPDELQIETVVPAATIDAIGQFVGKTAGDVQPGAL